MNEIFLCKSAKNAGAFFGNCAAWHLIFRERQATISLNPLKSLHFAYFDENTLEEKEHG
ncbi:MAG: hypothetical protein IKN81_00990 [Oscillospiraceae bacterium]|nr:hypothetical protein [Oscillospiraceae bacterium]